MKWVTVIAVFLGVACVIAYRQHHRVITFGQFQFLEIGMSKQEVINELISNQVVAVDSDFTHPRIDLENPEPSEQFKALLMYSAERKGALWLIKIAHGKISEIDQGFGGDELIDYFNVGDNV